MGTWIDEELLNRVVKTLNDTSITAENTIVQRIQPSLLPVAIPLDQKLPLENNQKVRIIQNLVYHQLTF